MPINRLQKTIRKWLVFQLIAIVAFAALTYCGALTATTLYFFGTAAIAKVHSVRFIDVGRSSGAKDTLAIYEYSDLNNEKHYKNESFAPAQ